MKSQTVGLRVASVIFGLGCLMHLVRLVAGVSMTIGDFHLGTVATVIGIIVAAGLSIWLWKLSLKQ
jgi:uncharacterized membrane protein